MTFDLPRLGALAIALALLAVGAAQILRALQAGAHLRTAVAEPGPVVIGSATLALVERAGPTPHRAYVDIVAGARRLNATTPVWIDPGAGIDDYARRYARRYTVFAPQDPARTGWQLLEIDHAASDASRVAFRLVELGPDGSVQVQTQTLPTGQARAELARLTLGLAPAPKFVFPAPLLMLVAAWLALRTVWRPTPAAWPTLILAAVMTALASLVAWPPMLQLGLARTLPGPVLAFAAVLLLAAAAGPKVQALASRGGRLHAAWVGAATGTALLVLFVLVQVNVAAFVAPVFRPPGGALSPAQWLVRDFVAPMALIGGTGLPLAVVAGACYGLLCRVTSKGSVQR